MSRFRRHYEIHFLTYELIVSVLVAGAVVLLMEAWVGQDGVVRALHGNRQALYVAVASIMGSLFGFVLATMAIIVGFLQFPRLRLVRESRHYGSIFMVFFNTIPFLAVATAGALVALLLDRDSAPKPWVTYFALWFVVIAMLRLYRCVWVLETVIRIAGGGVEETTRIAQ